MDTGENTREIGRKFEEKAFEFLKEKFDEVDWLSKKKYHSTFDFKCIKKGVVYNVESKFNSNENPFLTYSQKKADFVVTNKNNEIVLLKICDVSICSNIHEDKTKVEIETKILNELIKLKEVGDTYSNVINRLLLRYYIGDSKEYDTP